MLILCSNNFDAHMIIESTSLINVNITSMKAPLTLTQVNANI